MRGSPSHRTPRVNEDVSCSDGPSCDRGRRREGDPADPAAAKPLAAESECTRPKYDGSTRTPKFPVNAVTRMPISTTFSSLTLASSCAFPEGVGEDVRALINGTGDATPPPVARLTLSLSKRNVGLKNTAVCSGNPSSGTLHAPNRTSGRNRHASHSSSRIPSIGLTTDTRTAPSSKDGFRDAPSMLLMVCTARLDRLPLIFTLQLRSGKLPCA